MTADGPERVYVLGKCDEQQSARMRAKEDEVKAETLAGLREYAFRDGSDEDPLSIELGALIQSHDKLSTLADAVHEWIMKGGRPGRIQRIAKMLADAGYDVQGHH